GDMLRVSFFIGDEAIFTLELQMKENTRTGCIDLSNAYFNGVVISGIDRLEVDLSNAEMNNSRWYD
ncbi:T3SS effector EspY2, partial [Escherichia coli]